MDGVARFKVEKAQNGWLVIEDNFERGTLAGKIWVATSSEALKELVYRLTYPTEAEQSPPKYQAEVLKVQAANEKFIKD